MRVRSIRALLGSLDEEPRQLKMQRLLIGLKLATSEPPCGNFQRLLLRVLPGADRHQLIAGIGPKEPSVATVEIAAAVAQAPQ